MTKGHHQTAGSSRCFILDSGAVIGESKGDPKIRSLLREALNDDAILIVPTIVVTESYRADSTDVRLNRLLANAFVPEVDFAFAKVAGRLLAVTGASNAPDAQVVAEALRRSPCTILTSDYDDISRLVNHQSGISIIDVGKL